MKLTIFAGFVLSSLAGCGCTQAEKDSAEARHRAESRKTYVMQNDVEFHNYNRRQQIADDPSTVLWCTVEVGTEKVTVPVLGKLTSSHKRPFGATGENSNDVIGPDAMTGTVASTAMALDPRAFISSSSKAACVSTGPIKWHTSETTLALEVDAAMLETQRAVRAMLQDAARTAASIQPRADRMRTLCGRQAGC